MKNIRKWFTALLAEQQGQTMPSMTRFLCLICVLMACTIAGVCLYKGTSLDSASVICSVFLGAGLGSKVLQKKIEVDGQVAAPKVEETEPEEEK
jgi:hypothetical protein